MYGNLKRGEDTEQMGVIDWANWNTGRFPELKLLFHIPNGGKRDAREAARFKAMGVKAGVPDLCLPVPMNGFAGLYIEMKYGKNKPTDHQKEWIKALKEQGYKVTVCYSGVEATQELESYLQGVHTILSNPASEPCRPQKRMEIYCSGERCGHAESYIDRSGNARGMYFRRGFYTGRLRRRGKFGKLRRLRS